jgi:hypothetical protein
MVIGKKILILDKDIGIKIINNKDIKVVGQRYNSY